MIYVSRRLLITCLLLIPPVWLQVSGDYAAVPSRWKLAGIRRADGRCAAQYDDGGHEWRLPRVLMALLIGAALGVTVRFFSR